MILARVVEIQTPKKVRLNGLWFGSPTAKTVVVWVHGLGSSAFSRQDIVAQLARGDTAVLTFNNRGHDTVSRYSKGTKSVQGGSAHEVFTECVDDIDGAVAYAAAQGAQRLVLAGHSTGCQKSVYWAHKRKGKGVAGIVLLAPLADCVGLSDAAQAALPRALKAARTLVEKDEPHTLVLESTWPGPLDAQRLLSLYDSTSIEQSIFSYFDAARTPRVLWSVSLPVLVLFAGADEYADRPAEEIAVWFEEHVQHPSISIIDGVDHGFNGVEQEVVGAIRRWLAA